MAYNVPPEPQYGHRQEADAEAVKRAQEYQKQLEHQQLEQERRRKELADADLAAEMRRRNEQTQQR